jgi:2OG-Fe(II) oxygenase superfamily
VLQIGDRILTVFLYLNDVEEGGATTFPELNVTVLPKPGRVLIWPSVLDSSPKEIDWNTEHEANKVTKGEKYGANVWFHLKPFRLAYTHYQCCKTRRTYLENGPDAWKSGELDKMFQRIVQDPHFQAEYHTQVLSSPDMTYGNNNDDVDNIRNPWVVMLENFITPNEAERLIELGAEAGYMESEINEKESDNDGTDEIWRTSMTSWCRDECMEDPVAESVLERIYNLTEFDDPYSENMQFLKYEKGQL